MKNEISKKKKKKTATGTAGLVNPNYKAAPFEHWFVQVLAMIKQRRTLR